MNTTQTLVPAAVALAFISTFVQTSAQGLPATAGVVHGTLDGHVLQTQGSAAASPRDFLGRPLAHDLELSVSEGRRHADPKGANVTITGPTGVKVFSVDEAGALTDLDLPSGHYDALADFGRVKRMGAVDVQEGELATLHLHGPSEPV